MKTILLALILTLIPFRIEAHSTTVILPDYWPGLGKTSVGSLLTVKIKAQQPRCVATEIPQRIILGGIVPETPEQIKWLVASIKREQIDSW